MLDFWVVLACMTCGLLRVYVDIPHKMSFTLQRLTVHRVMSAFTSFS